MKIKLVMLITMITLLTSCSFVSKDFSVRYKNLNKRFYKLTDDEIKEKERARLQKDYEKFIKNMEGDVKDADIETILKIRKYTKKSKIKLQFLKDLK